MAAKVLLVEDDNNLREIYEARLVAEGYNIVTAKDGEEALVVAKAETPDLVISDVMMPRISGFEMLDILRNTEALRDTKVIMLTALGQADDKTRANSLGADRYLVKSQVTLEDIVKAAHELLEGISPEVAATAGATPGTASAATPPVMPVASPLPVSTAPAAAIPVTPAPAPAAAPSPAVQSEPTTAPALAQPASAATPVATTPPQPISPAFNPNLGATLVQPAAPAVPPSMPAFPTPTPETTSDMSAPDLNAAPTTSDEQATVGAQIDDFVRTAQPAAEVEPTANTTQDDAVMADAVQDLATNAEEKAAEPAPTTIAPTRPILTPAPLTPSTPTDPPVAPTSINDNVAIANKKIIQPIITTEPKMGIHELLAREEKTGGMLSPASAAPVTTFSPGMTSPQAPPAVQATPPAFSPAPEPVAPPVPAPQAPAAPTGQNDADPNNIAL